MSKQQKYMETEESPSWTSNAVGPGMSEFSSPNYELAIARNLENIDGLSRQMMTTLAKHAASKNLNLSTTYSADAQP